MYAATPPPSDGTCAQCGKPRGVGAKNARARAAARLDPFCSTECARLWHGTALAAPGPREQRGYVSKVDARR